jgi:quercetin dioxygenase-like cupin family protein
VPIGQAQELYTGLKQNGVPVEMVVYPREPHGLREPNHQLDKMEREMAWFGRYVLGESAAAAAGSAGAGAAAGSAGATSRGERLVFENDRVRVVEFLLEAGMAMGMHNHPRDRVEITLSTGHVRVTTEDGKTQEVEETVGVVFSKANLVRHDVENIGTTTIRAYHVELK